MSELVLKSQNKHALRPIVEAAIRNELRLLQAGIHRTEQRLKAFEARHGMTSAEFIKRYESDELEEALEFAEWIGEHRLLNRLREKVSTLQSIDIAD